MSNKNRSVVIVAGGTGKRMGSIIPKQFIELSGKPMLMWTIGRFYIFDKKMQIILVLPKDEIARWGELCNKHNFTVYHQIVSGGKKRFESVKKGLSLVNKGALTAIHDGVRPLVSYETIETWGKEWFTNLVLIAGDGIPFDPESIDESEYLQGISCIRYQDFMMHVPTVQKILNYNGFCTNL